MAKNPGGEVEREVTVLNLAVRGSSASIHPQRPKTLTECKAYTFVRQKKRNKNFAFPVDRIVYLAERLELTTSSETEENRVSLSAVDVPTRNSPISLQESPKKRPDASPASPFSLDLSSITARGDESDEAAPHFGPPTPDRCARSSASVRSLGDLCGTTRTTTDRSHCRCQPLRRPECQTSHACCDLVNLYVNSVDEHGHLLKYFRPCCAPPRSLGPATPDARPMDACECPVPAVSPHLDSSRCSRPFTPLRHEDRLCNCTPQKASQSPSTSSSSSSRNLAYASSLANAARSARLLARDLELVLTALGDDAE